MNHSFNASKGLVVVHARVWGPRGQSPIEMALDTAATGTVISATVMAGLGYDLKNCLERVRMTSASGVAAASRVVAKQFEALGCTKQQFPIVCHDFPQSASIKGLVGLDFLRNLEFNINFRTGKIELK